MRIVLNGEEVTIPGGSTITDLLLQYQLEPSQTIAEVNASIVSKESYSAFSLKAQDRVELIRFMGGGGGAKVELRAPLNIHFFCHSRESGNLGPLISLGSWIPVFTG